MPIDVENIYRSLCVKDDESRIRLIYGPIILIPIRSITEIAIKSKINQGIFFFRIPNIVNIFFTNLILFMIFSNNWFQGKYNLQFLQKKRMI